MGCVASKKAVSVTPAFERQDSSAVLASRYRAGIDCLERKDDGERIESGESNGTSSRSFRLRNLHRYIEGEQVAAGWPSWFSAVAGEAIQGWVPLKADNFEKLEKVGQGTYSSVFRARDLETGKIVALKKVRFDNFDPESVRFMAREIQILRRLDHPNIVKLEGLITSRLSCSMYLVFEYMEHDLVGLSSSPDIKFTESQVKCYMRQLLFGLEHCHSRGIIHRDIKGANLLVNNEGILKIADFGLANFYDHGKTQPLTSRVVTLWYRPPELLLGSTDYEATVDLWSVGCVFAEMFCKKPILQGRTEVEQLHKIFKLCGSPSDEYWKNSKLPNATIFKPHHPYDNCLWATFKDLPANAFRLLETFLSVEPHKRGTASSALASEYFTTKPYACEPSSLPKYPPNKEIDAKYREESQRQRQGTRGHASILRPSRTCKASRETSGRSKLAADLEETKTNTHEEGKSAVKQDHRRMNGDTRLFVDLQPMATINPPDKGRHVKHISQGDIPFSGPLLVPASSGFAWVKKPKEDQPYVRPLSKSSSKSSASGALDPPDNKQAKNGFEPRIQSDGDAANGASACARGHKQSDIAKYALLKKWAQLERPDSFDASDLYHSQKFAEAFYSKDLLLANHSILDYQHEREKIEFSGPLLSQSHKVDELLQKHERHIRQAVRRSWLQRVTGIKQGR
ncbi:hypothetical protein J5N97_010312 [Dioscorea zingiberensis]|uniref:[RNA-polymerase]-subunit kinase n=1 Tax=Dioscorea zingiberensis TaxID=325984 RepID=A0A9D5CZX4_9LILI|nr:hypothetical protein J5N97_010312 [Dioscorea zingiberensis]